MTREEAISTLERKYCENARFCGELYDFECQNIYCEIWWSIEALKNREPVVRCKDCDRVHIDFDDEGRTIYSCNHYNPLRIMVSGDGRGYCSNGRPKK